MSVGELATSILVLSVLAHGLVVVLICLRDRASREPARSGLVAAAYALAALITARLTTGPGTAASLTLALVIGCTAVALMRDFARLGALLLATHLQLMLGVLLWGTWFIFGIPVSPLTRWLIIAGYPLLLLRLRAGLVQTFETSETLCRLRWHRPRAPLRGRPDQPLVSLHVPVHKEPPEMVIATLDALAALDYPNLEILVVDNNTEDPRLWTPVRDHCRQLGDRFRFFHETGVSGAKAGALNVALRHTSPRAEIIGLVDSDYVVAPDFVSRLIGHFDDPSTGFVQSPHDYRRWEHSRFLRMCYWEYRLFFHTALPSLNERGAAYSVGTMCLFRRRAVEEAGGWAEWCVTEDSEIAVRIHALGYRSVYVRETFGRGLIPETFAGYKQQRYRWTYGPVQELKHHFRLLMPRPLGRRSALTTVQKFYHLNHGLERSMIGLSVLFTPVGIALAVSMASHHEVVRVPAAFLLTGAVLLVTGFATRTLLYRMIGCSVLDSLGALVATAALRQTVTMASVAGLITRRMPWRRTSKFATRSIGLRCLGPVSVELALGVGAVLFGCWAMLAVPHPGLLLLVGGGLILGGIGRLAAPAMALLADREASGRQLAAVATATGIVDVGGSGDDAMEAVRGAARLP